ncbi:ATP-binding protein [Marinicella meishanensis]|uniref:ATP-binding protein n=1 Tax=Marinicella meishanensis TaxID=2873263 RepID=UPI001CC036C3|nr:ATP-binding protein [Marinicella sp. NBU2979]
MKGVIFIGIQGSGKSTFFKQQLQDTHLCLSMDMLKTRHRERLLFQACLQAKQPVVIDNTNPTVADRAKYIEGFKTHQFSVTGYYFKSELAACLQRNEQRTGKACIPEAGIRGTYGKLQLPTKAEGFDELYYLEIINDEFVIEAWNDEI